jgi:guanosine-3',5'-bis(diphosphate) 3'-pyrophosphohydrolase
MSDANLASSIMAGPRGPDPQVMLEELLVACRKNLQTLDEEKIRRAFRMCFEAHKNNVRASGEPYFTHPVHVAMIVAQEMPLDDVSVISALLHDVVEDTDFTMDDIRAEFGEEVAEIVDGATKISGVFESREINVAEYYRKLLLSMTSDIRVMLIKFADRLHNMRTLQHLPEERRRRIARETLDIYAPFAHRFGLGKIKWELEDLAFKFLEPEEYVRVKNTLNLRREEREHYIEQFVEPIRHALDERKVKYEVTGRPKHLYSIFNKTTARNKSVDEIYDLFAVRIVVDTEDANACFGVYGLVTDCYTPVPERFKDYISVPKKNGYQSIHTTVIGPGGRMVEVQIRTKAMDEAAHWKYKEHTAAVDKELEYWINWARDLFAQPTAETPREFLESFKLNLYQDEIYIFTPKGDLRILPKNATPVDFAFEIHTAVGGHCIGAKVNGRIVPLNHRLKSGDQVEIITSKHQQPNKDWETFVVSHKAKTQIKRWLNEQKRVQVEHGHEEWERALRREKLHYNDDDVTRVAHRFRFDSARDMYIAIASGQFAIGDIVPLLHDRAQLFAEEKESVAPLDQQYRTFVQTARLAGVTIEGAGGMVYVYAKCCNPVPGDDVVGIVTVGEGIKVHRRTCQNVAPLLYAGEPRLIDVSWQSNDSGAFIAGLRISGTDRAGLLHEITHAISSYESTNIRSVTIETEGEEFSGTLVVYVRNVDHLNRLIELISRIPGVDGVVRFEEQG